MLWFLSETTEQTHQEWGAVLREDTQHQGGLEGKCPAGSSTWMNCCACNSPQLAILKLKKKKPISWQWVNPNSSSVRICVSISDYGWGDGMSCPSLYIAKEMTWHLARYVTWCSTKKTSERKLLRALKWESWCDWVERETYVEGNCGRHKWERVSASSKQ